MRGPRFGTWLFFKARVTLTAGGSSNFDLLVTQGWDEYRLIDSGDGRKLEKFGPYFVDRPEPQAMWRRRDEAIWAQADAVFAGEEDAESGRWKFKSKPIDTWQTAYQDLEFFGRFTAFRHMGYFPEQSLHWDWMVERLQQRQQPRLLNLFGYTGIASLLAARAGAQVTHVDASKKAIGWARENQSLAGMDSAPIRWICEDARKFVAREGRRGKTYDGILIDPPKFGRGTDNEVWDLFIDLRDMLNLCREVLAQENSFLILTSYAIRASHLSFHELCRDLFPQERVHSGELAIQEFNASSKQAGRLLSTSHYCRVVR